MSHMITPQGSLASYQIRFRDEYINERSFKEAAFPEEARAAALDLVTYMIDAFTEAVLFGIALPEQAEPGIIYSVHTPG